MTPIRESLHSITNRRTIGYFAAFIALGLYISTLGPTLPFLAEHTGSELDQISILFTVRALGYLIGSLMLGKSYDRLPGHILMAAVIIIMGLMMTLVPIIPILWLLALVLFALGIGEGALDVGGNTLLVWTHGKKVGPYMNGLHFFFGVGAFLSPILLAQTFLINGGIELGYWILALYALPVALWLIRTPSPTPPAKINDHIFIPVDKLLVILITIFYFLYTSAESSFGGWIYTYTIELGLSEPAQAAYLTSAFWGALTIGRLIAIPIATRFRPRIILLADLIGCLASVAVILVFYTSLYATWIGTLGMGLSMASLFPTMLLISERRMTLTGNITRWFFVGAGLGGMFLPWFIGQLFTVIGPIVTMLLIAFDLVIALLVLIKIINYPLKNNSKSA